MKKIHVHVLTVESCIYVLNPVTPEILAPHEYSVGGGGGGGALSREV